MNEWTSSDGGPSKLSDTLTRPWELAHLALIFLVTSEVTLASGLNGLQFPRPSTVGSHPHRSLQLHRTLQREWYPRSSSFPDRDQCSEFRIYVSEQMQMPRRFRWIEIPLTRRELISSIGRFVIRFWVSSFTRLPSQLRIRIQPPKSLLARLRFLRVETSLRQPALAYTDGIHCRAEYTWNNEWAPSRWRIWVLQVSWM